jgi:hypothetical protein
VKGNRRLHVIGFQGGKSGENFFDGIAGSQTGQHGPKGNSSAAKNRLAATNVRVSYDPVFVLHQRIPLPQNFLDVFRIGIIPSAKGHVRFKAEGSLGPGKALDFSPLTKLGIIPEMTGV